MRTASLSHALSGLCAALACAAAGLLTPFCPALAADRATDAPAAAAAAAAAPAEAGRLVYEARFMGLSMGTIVSARLYSEDEKTAARLADLFEKKTADYETLFTVHGEGPLNEVNRRSGSWVSVDCRLAALVQAAKDVARSSNRAFEPTIGTLVNVWKIGFGGDRHPPRADIEAALKKVDYTQIAVDETPGACRVKIGAGQSIDLGAIAKGWIGTALARDMQRAGARHGIIDLGGNVSLIGSSPSGEPWRVGIQRPDAERNTVMAVVQAENVSVITSGAYERKIEADGRTYGHILSAVTGEPVGTDLASVTIVNPDGARADGWCTALFAMGSEKALESAAREGLSVILASGDLKTLWVSRAIADRVTVQDKSMKIEIVP